MVVTIAVLSTLKRSASEPVLTGHRHTPHEVAAGDIGAAALAGRASPSERTGIPATAATSLRIMVIPLRSGDASAPILAVPSRLVRLSAQAPRAGVPDPATDEPGVTATSARNAWAVGNTGPVLAAAASPRNVWAADVTGGHQVIKPKALILHWNGKAWTRVPSPSPAGGALLLGVTATSARNAWAVGGNSGFGGKEKALVLRWNRTALE